MRRPSRLVPSAKREFRDTQVQVTMTTSDQTRLPKQECQWLISPKTRSVTRPASLSIPLNSMSWRDSTTTPKKSPTILWGRSGKKNRTKDLARVSTMFSQDWPSRGWWEFISFRLHVRRQRVELPLKRQDHQQAARSEFSIWSNEEMSN